MRSVLVCVRTPLAAQAVLSAATQLGLTDLMSTVIGGSEALARVTQAPPDVVLVDTVAVRPDMVGFTRRVLERSPNAVVIYFGAEEPAVAQAALNAGARGLIRGGDREDLVASVAKALMLLLRPSRPSGVGNGSVGAAGVSTGNFSAAGASVAGASVGVNSASCAQAGPVPTATAPVSGAPSVAATPVSAGAGAGGAGAGPTGVGPTGVGPAGVGPNGVGSSGPGPIGSVPTGAVAAALSGVGGTVSQAVPLQRFEIGEGEVAEATDATLAGAAAAVDVAGTRRLALTDRELQVLRGMADGKSNAEIGRDLFVSEDTVKTHARRLFRKLGARDRAHAVAAAFRAGLVS